MKKTTVTLLLCLVLALSLTSAALADVIYEPADDFYFSHLEECGHVNRSFYVNAPSGAAEYAAEPGGKVSGSYPNGQEVYVSATYTDKSGADWGYAEIFDSGEKGWALLSDLLLNTTARASMRSSAPRSGNTTGPASTSGRKPPSSGPTPSPATHAGTLGPENGFNEELTFYESWTDEQGRLWGHIGYFYGIRDRWVCVSDRKMRGSRRSPGRNSPRSGSPPRVRPPSLRSLRLPSPGSLPPPPPIRQRRPPCSSTRSPRRTTPSPTCSSPWAPW
jgi:hypothetical protein